MANKYTPDELAERVKSPGWGLAGGKDGAPVKGTLEEVLTLAHQQYKSGQKPGLIAEIETAIELEMVEIDLLWRYLGLPV